MRVRSTALGGFTNQLVREYDHRSPANCSTGYTQWLPDFVSYSGSSYLKTITDIPTPNFSALKKAGVFLPPNPVDIVTQIEERIPSSYQTAYSSVLGGGACYRYRTQGPLWQYTAGFLSVPPVDEVKLNLAVTNAVADAQNGVMDLLTSLAEMHKSLDFCAGAVGRLVELSLRIWDDIYRKLKTRRKGNITYRDAVSWSRTFNEVVAEVWLSYRYAIRPIIFDVEDATKAIKQIAKRTDYIRGRHLIGTSLNAVQTGVVLTNWPADQRTTITDEIVGSRVYRGFAVAVPNNDLAIFRMDPLVTAYELIPLSWAFDRLIDLGSFIEAWSPFNAVNLCTPMGSVRTSYTRTVTTQVEYGTNFAAGTPNVIWKTKYSVDQYTRTVESPSPFPRWNLRFTKEFALDILSLVVGYRGRVDRARFRALRL